MFSDCILSMSSCQSANLRSCFVGECAFLPPQCLAICCDDGWISTTVTCPVMFTLLLVILLAIISWMLSVYSVSSCSRSGILVKSNVISLLLGSDSLVLLLMCTLSLSEYLLHFT